MKTYLIIFLLILDLALALSVAVSLNRTIGRVDELAGTMQGMERDIDGDYRADVVEGQQR